ncbi:hypothetical protein Taro_035369 [Colocasia esculenta]|uniref:Uncharacterized protein n=1 Tax=Colocasia esculenta TaxID=4460 RepID=A0A843WIF2_COLES|nr:hypothetical protein [Colocasia esculenta]
MTGCEAYADAFCWLLGKFTLSCFLEAVQDNSQPMLMLFLGATIGCGTGEACQGEASEVGGGAEGFTS